MKNIGKNLAKLVIPILLISGCEIDKIYEYHGKLKKEYVDCTGIKGFELILSVKKEDRIVVEYNDLFDDKKLDTIEIIGKTNRYLITEDGIMNIIQNKTDVIGDEETGKAILRLGQEQFTNYLNEILEIKNPGKH